jgi:glutamate racemase
MVGIFDSGSGGLTVMKAVRELLPTSDIVYFGDIKHAPYGSKSQEELSRYTAESLALLKREGAERIISACNSVSASLALSLFDAFDMQPGDIIEMVGPTVSYFKGSDARIALCATPATIRAGIYQNAFRMIGREVAAVPMPGLADAIEFAHGEQAQRELIEGALKDMQWDRCDALLLACTHYPLVLDLFRSIVPPRVMIFDPAIAVAERAQRQFWPQEVRDTRTRFLISQDSEPFRALVKKMFPDAAQNIEVVG